jgi:hypothetical protein
MASGTTKIRITATATGMKVAMARATGRAAEASKESSLQTFAMRKGSLLVACPK